MMGDLNTDLDLELLAKGNNLFFGNDNNFENDSLIGGFTDDEDSGMGMIVIAVVMGCIAAIVLLYIVRQNTTLPETIANFLDKKVPTMLRRNRKVEETVSADESKAHSPTPTSMIIEAKSDTGNNFEKDDKDDRDDRDEKNDTDEKDEEDDVETMAGVGNGARDQGNQKHEDEAAGETEEKKSVSHVKETMPVLLNASKSNSKSRSFPVKLNSFNTTMTSEDSLPKPKLPGVPKANNIEGSAKVLKANKQLIEAAQTGDLRKKLSRASWGVAPILDRKDELPYYTSSKTHIITPEREQFLKNQVSKNTQKIITAGAVPVLFDLPQSFNMKKSVEEHTLGSSLQLETRD